MIVKLRPHARPLTRLVSLLFLVFLVSLLVLVNLVFLQSSLSARPVILVFLSDCKSATRYFDAVDFTLLTLTK